MLVKKTTSGCTQEEEHVVLILVSLAYSTQQDELRSSSYLFFSNDAHFRRCTIFKCGVLSADMSVHHVHAEPDEPEEGERSPRLEI